MSPNLVVLHLVTRKKMFEHLRLVLFSLFLMVVSVGMQALFFGRSHDGQVEISSIERMFQEMADNSARGTVPSRTYRLTESELNAYFEQKVQEQLQPGLEKVLARLSDDTLIIILQVDMDELSVEKKSPSSALLLTLLRGKQTFEVEGNLRAKDGMGQYNIRRANLNGVLIPSEMVTGLLSALGRKYYPLFDLSQPFHMPYGIQTIKIQVGQATIETGS